MAIVINHNPPSYSSAHGDLIFTVYEATKAIDPATYPDYKYIADLYIDGDMVYRARTFPNPSNQRGLFNFSQVVRNYLSLVFNPASGLVAQEFAAGEFYVDVQIKFGEEYSYTTYTNLLTDSTRRYYNHYNNQITSAETILDAYVDTFATNRPLKTSVLFNATNVFIPYFASTTTPFDLVIKTYEANVLIDTQTQSITPTLAGDIIQLNISPYEINAAFTGLITDDTDYYTVTVGAVTYRFDIACENIYTPYTLHFLNQLGGFDSFEFRKVSKKSYDIEKKDYTQLPYRMASDGSINYSNSGGVVNETKTTYSSIFKPKQRITTDLLTNAEWAWLKELVFSPLVYLQEGLLFKPVSIVSSNYEEKTFLTDKLTSLVLDIDLGVTLNAQFR